MRARHSLHLSTVMKTISIGFSNMWGALETFTTEYFLKCFPYLRPYYDFVLDPDDPDFVFYSVYGFVQKRAPRATRILFSGEAEDPFASPENRMRVARGARFCTKP